MRQEKKWSARFHHVLYSDHDSPSYSGYCFAKLKKGKNPSSSVIATVRETYIRHQSRFLRFHNTLLYSALTSIISYPSSFPVLAFRSCSKCHQWRRHSLRISVFVSRNTNIPSLQAEYEQWRAGVFLIP